jgi:hypothetical protein
VVKSTRRTITAAITATVTVPLTARGRQLHRSKRDIPINATFTPKGSKKAKAVYAPGRR